MFKIRNFFDLPYSSDKMFILVNNISAYSEFIPWCVYSRILMENDHELIAEIRVSRFGINESFITHNFMIKNRSISIHLIRGPFKFFFGKWEFIDINQSISRVGCMFSYEFHSILREKIFDYVCEDIVSSLVEAFICRARITYHI